MSNIKDLKFDDKNFNDHTEFGMSLLEKSLQDYGAGRSILIDKNNNIIAGNGIVEAAAQAGIENVRIIETQGDELVAVKRTDVDLNTQKGREMAFADNATASVDLSWNEDNIKEFFTEEDTEKWGITISPIYDENNIIEDNIDDIKIEDKIISKSGNIYKLGNHRVACGDSLDNELINKLFSNNTAKVIFSSPPYNMGKGKMYDKYEDNREAEEYIKFNLDILFNWGKHHKGFLFWNTNNNSNNNSYYLELLCDIKNKTKYKMLEMIHWDKNNAIPVGGKNLKRQAENIMFMADEPHEINIIYYGDDGNGKTNNTRKKISNYWGIMHEGGSIDAQLNCATYPVKLPARGISFTSKQNDIIADPFLGTGSTLIACEQMGRICYGCEMDEQQVDLIRKRYWKFKTGSEDGWEIGTPEL